MTSANQSLQQEIGRAAECLRRGGLVAFPTETVYGLGANALDPVAVARIFEVKQRPFFDPLIVHMPDLDWLSRLACTVPACARRLAELFWPGPLTLVLPRQPLVPDLVTSGLDTVALRIPDHPVASALLAAAQLPLAAPSANRFGRISPTCADHVRSGLGSAVDSILDGGDCRVGVESTILAFAPDGDPVLLRPGGTPLDALEAACGRAVLRMPPGGQPHRPPAPGLLERHYAPTTPLSLFPFGAPLPPVPPGLRTGLLLFQSRPGIQTTAGYSQIAVLSETGSLADAAHRLFAALRRLDDAGLDELVAETAPDAGLGEAINDRLRRASAR